MPASSAFLRPYEAAMQQFTDSPAIFHRACSYAVSGPLLARYNYRCRLEGGSPPRWTNLWILLEGASGQARKSTAISMAQEVLMRVDETILAPDDGSPEGFLASMHQSDISCPGNANTVLFAPEFSAQLSQMQRTYAAQFKSILMGLYDAPKVYKKALAKTNWAIPSPRVSIVGGIATELLPQLSESNDWLGGFFSRFIIIHGERTKLMERGRTPPDKVMQALAVGLFHCLKTWRLSQKKLKRPLFDYSKKAAKLAADLPAPPKEPNLAGTLSRAASHLMKLAALEQIDEDPTAHCIEAAAVERARVLLDYWLKSVPGVIESCFARGNADFEGDRLAMRIKRYLTGCGGEATWGLVMQNCALDSDRMVRAVQSLLDAALVEVDDAPTELGSTKNTKALQVIRLIKKLE